MSRPEWSQLSRSWIHPAQEPWLSQLFQVKWRHRLRISAIEVSGCRDRRQPGLLQLIKVLSCKTPIKKHLQGWKNYSNWCLFVWCLGQMVNHPDREVVSTVFVFPKKQHLYRQQLHRHWSTKTLSPAAKIGVIWSYSNVNARDSKRSHK